MAQSRTATRSATDYHPSTLPPPDGLLPSATPARNGSDAPVVRVERDVGDVIALKLGSVDGLALVRMELPSWLYGQDGVRRLCAQFMLDLARIETDAIGADDGDVIPFPPPVAG